MKVNGPIHLSGSYDDLVFYTLNGQPVARKKGSISKSTLKNDPKYQSFRRQSAEFAQVQKLGGMIRRMLINGHKYLRDIPGDNQLNRILGRVKDHGTEREKTVRDFDFIQNGWMLRDFEFHSQWAVRDLLRFNPQVSFDAASGTATLSVPSFDGRRSVKVPPCAAYVQIFLSLGVLSNYEFSDHYRPVIERSFPLHGMSGSGFISLSAPALPLQLSVTPPDKPVAGSETVLVGMGIEFLTKGKERIETHCGMRVVGVF